jgi:hypothetical protein
MAAPGKKSETNTTCTIPSDENIALYFDESVREKLVTESSTDPLP